VKFYQVKTQVLYGQEVKPSREKSGTYPQEKEYDYILDVNASGQIVGGSWLGNSITDHPDFVWSTEAVSSKTIKPEFKSILDIYKKASGGSVTNPFKKKKTESKRERRDDNAGDEEENDGDNA
jgi:hypothetical protein